MNENLVFKNGAVIDFVFICLVYFLYNCQTGLISLFEQSYKIYK